MKEAYPTDTRGVPVIPDELECYEECAQRQRAQRFKKNRHHLAFPQTEYANFTARNYRECSAMIIQICHCRHDDLHATYGPPEHPSPSAMCDIAQEDSRPQTALDADIGVFIRRRADHERAVS